jgi:hypothetical protein
LLRKDRPNWPRPLKVSGVWVGICVLLTCYCIAILVVGAGSPALNGYGNWTDFFIGIGVLAVSLLLFFYRRIVEDKEKVHWKEETPTMPEGADRDALIAVGWNPTDTAAQTVPTAG